MTHSALCAQYNAGASSFWSAAGDKFSANVGSNVGKYDDLELAHSYDLPAWRDYEECVVDAEVRTPGCFLASNAAHARTTSG